MHSIYTVDQRPHLRTQIQQLSLACWPEFLLRADVPQCAELSRELARFQPFIVENDEEVVAAALSIPFHWDGTREGLPSSIDEISARGVQAWKVGATTNTLCVLAAMVHPERRGTTLAIELLETMKSIARRDGLTSMIVPVRPTLKTKYPLTPMERYVKWTRSDGSLFDPWIRLHTRLGAHSLGVLPAAMTLRGSVADWEEWTKMRFPESGDYIVEGALQPVSVNVASNLVHYDEPNLWMRHPM